MHALWKRVVSMHGILWPTESRNCRVGGRFNDEWIIMGALRSDAGEPSANGETPLCSLYLWADDDGNFGRGIDGETVAERIWRRFVASWTAVSVTIVTRAHPMHRRENLISSHLRYISNIKRQRFRDKIISLSYHRLIAREDTCHDTISVTKEQSWQ